MKLPAARLAWPLSEPEADGARESLEVLLPSAPLRYSYGGRGPPISLLSLVVAGLSRKWKAFGKRYPFGNAGLPRISCPSKKLFRTSLTSMSLESAIGLSSSWLNGLPASNPRRASLPGAQKNPEENKTLATAGEAQQDDESACLTCSNIYMRTRVTSGWEQSDRIERKRELSAPVSYCIS